MAEGVPFGFHVYDLSRGFATRFAESLTGAALPNGVLHAAVAIFGHEYFFEGGISKRPAGCTRFGKNFAFVASPARATAVRAEAEFDAWIRAAECGAYGTIAYKITDSNCLHFCDAAARFLTGGAMGAPDLIARNTAPLAATPVGRLLFDVVKLMSQTGMLKSCELMRERQLCRIATFHALAVVRERAIADNGIAARDYPPPTTRLWTFCDRAADVDAAVSRLAVIVDDAWRTTRRPATALVAPTISLERLRSFWFADAAAAPTTTMTASEATTLVSALVFAAFSRGRCATFAALGDVLRFFTQLAAFDNFCLAAVHDAAALVLLRNVSGTFFAAMPEALKLRTLELFCNLLRAPESAAVLSRMPAQTVPFMIARGLLDPSSWAVVHRASCALVNFVYASLTLRHVHIDSDLASASGVHKVASVVTAALLLVSRVLPRVDDVKTVARIASPALAAAHVKGRTGNTQQQPATNTVDLRAVAALLQIVLENALDAIVAFAFTGRTCQAFVSRHPMLPQHKDLIAKCASVRARALAYALARVTGSA
jgi:hypothetical protein